MPAPNTDLIHGYLDETLTAQQQGELANWIKASPDHAKQFAESILLHDRLRAEMLASDVLEDHSQVAARTSSPKRRWGRRVVAIAAAACLTLVVGSIAWQALSTPVLAASVELQRIIRASASAMDRTYVVTALDNAVAAESPSPIGRGAKPSVDGAMLHVRGPNQYVLVRFFADGTEFITGSDGTIAWSIPPHGRVRVSSDPTRFRGAVPGQQHAIPFIDMGTSLQQLQNSYELDLTPEPSPEGWRRLDATRKATVEGGPKQVTIWYDAQSGSIQALRLERLPQAHGGPKSVLLNLIDQAELPSDFFTHEAHHDRGRRLVWEPEQQ